MKPIKNYFKQILEQNLLAEVEHWDLELWLMEVQQFERQHQ